MTDRARLVECVPNVSEGRRQEVVDEIVAAFAGADPGVLVLDHSSDPDHNRAVITLAGPGPALVEAAVAGARACARLIDLNHHRGVHPRMGALDVLPFVPLGEATRLAGAGDPDLDCAALAERAGRRIAAEAGVPVYLYGAAARDPARAALPAVRGRGFEALRDAPGSPGGPPRRSPGPPTSAGPGGTRPPGRRPSGPGRSWSPTTWSWPGPTWRWPGGSRPRSGNATAASRRSGPWASPWPSGGVRGTAGVVPRRIGNVSRCR